MPTPHLRDLARAGGDMASCRRCLARSWPSPSRSWAAGTTCTWSPTLAPTPPIRASWSDSARFAGGADAAVVRQPDLDRASVLRHLAAGPRRLVQAHDPADGR